MSLRRGDVGAVVEAVVAGVGVTRRQFAGVSVGRTGETGNAGVWVAAALRTAGFFDFVTVFWGLSLEVLWLSVF